MPSFAQISLGALLLVAVTTAGAGAQVDKPVEPLGANLPFQPLTRQQRDQREALKLYCKGLFHLRERRLLEAIQAFEQALRLESEAAAIHRALIGVYLALDRTDDALA